MSGRAVYIALLLGFTAILRIAPFLELGVPYSTDSWGLLRNTRVLVDFSPISIASQLFDGYNNFWPASTVSLSILTIVAGGDVYVFSELLMVASFIVFTVLLFATGCRVYGGSSLALITVYTGFFISYLQMTGGFTKEGYAYPLYALILYYAIAEGDFKKLVLPVVLVTASLALTHHLTMLVVIAVAYGLLINGLMSFATRVEDVRIRHYTFILVAAVLAGFTHYLLLGRYSMLSIASPWLAVSLASSITLAVLINYLLRLLLLYQGSRAGVGRECLERLAIAFLALGLTIAIGLNTGVWSGGRQNPTLGLTLSTLGFASLITIATVVNLSRGNFLPATLITSCIASVLGVMLFAVVEEIPDNFTLLYRLVSFLAPPAVLSASSRVGRASTATASVYALLMLCTYILLQMGIAPELGWHWRYSIGDVYLAGYVSSYLRGGVYSDVKYQSILKSYYGVDVGIWNGVLKGVVVVDEYMFTRGMLQGPGLLTLLEISLFRELLAEMNLIACVGGSRWIFYS